MLMTRLKAATAATLMVLGLAACGNAGDDNGDSGPDVKVSKNAADSFADGSRMKELAQSGKVTIGVKFDQPGIGFKGAADKEPKGLDPEIGKILAASLGIKPENIIWTETISANREPFLQKSQVDLV